MLCACFRARFALHFEPASRVAVRPALRLTVNPPLLLAAKPVSTLPLVVKRCDVTLETLGAMMRALGRAACAVREAPTSTV